MPILQIGPSMDSLANDYIGANVRVPPSYSGSRADLEQQIKDHADACGNYVHRKNALYNTRNSRNLCKQKLNALYAPIMDAAMQQTAAEEAQLKTKLFEGNEKTYMTIGLVFVFLLMTVIILRY